MAEKRMISKVISISKKFNIELKDHFSRLLYVLLIPHSDDFGRLTGDPFKIKALILPMMNEVTQDDVAKSLGNLHSTRLICWYEADGEKYIQINNFDEHQTGLHKRTRSKFPEPPNNSEKFPEIPLEEKRREQNGIEGKGREQDEKSALLSRVNFLQIQTKGIFELEQLYSYIGVMEFDVIMDAINRSEKQKKLSYTLGILEDRNKKRLHTVEACISAGEMKAPPKEHGELEAQREQERAKLRVINDPINYEPAEELRSVVNG